MKRRTVLSGIALISVLVIIDQVIKLIIAENVSFYFCCDYCLNLVSSVKETIIPGFIYFEPMLNAGFNVGTIRLLALFNINILKTSQTLLVSTFFTFTVMIIIPLLLRYCIYITKKQNFLIYIGFSFAFSGAICSWIDTAFWGGSLDFIRLFNWFIFDFKDIYLTVFLLLLLFWLIIYYKYYYIMLDKEERRREKQEVKFTKWVRKGCPLDR